MSAPSRRVVVSALAVAALVAPSLPALGAMVGGSQMVARAGATADRARPVATTSPVTDAERLAAEVVLLTNAERAAAGRPALSVHPAAATAAMSHSADQAASQRMSHTGSDGSDAGTRLTRAGYVWRTWGENVAAGQRTAQQVVSAWMGSSGHRANILNGSFTTIGVGVATGADGRMYWTMVLAA